jgi:hypothetical protein
MVCEFGCGEHQYAILADLLPEMLDKEVTKHKVARVEASLLLQPDELKAALPVIDPKMNIVEGLPIPCVGLFGVANAKEENWPMIDTKAWRTLANAICEKDCDDGCGIVSGLRFGNGWRWVVVGRDVVGWRLARYLDTGASHHRCGGVWMGSCGGG